MGMTSMQWNHNQIVFRTDRCKCSDILYTILAISDAISMIDKKFIIPAVRRILVSAILEANNKATSVYKFVYMITL